MTKLRTQTCANECVAMVRGPQCTLYEHDGRGILEFPSFYENQINNRCALHVITPKR